MKYERETDNLLRRLGVNNSYVGFRYTIYGVIRAIANPELLNIHIKRAICRNCRPLPNICRMCRT